MINDKNIIKVLIADDHTIVRDGIRQIIDSEPQLKTVAEAENGNQVLELTDKIQIDVVVLDITMPGRNGLETLKELRKLHPKIAVLVLSMHPKDQYAIRVLKAGASGYITKESASEVLVTAIKKVYRGEKYIGSIVSELLANYIQHENPDSPHEILSDRELEVFCLIGNGKSVSQISAQLNLSVKTISTYRRRILEKTQFLNNAEITRYCIERNLS
jgi:DNA-binding NarL/FixJ family response regulator